MTKREPLRHPRDTGALLLKHQKDSENLWYRVHYGQGREWLQYEKDDKNDKRKKDDKMNMFPMSHFDMGKPAKDMTTQVVENLKKSLLDRGDTHWVRFYEGKLSGSLITGLGGEHVRETSLTLHQLYGVPYIPASSLKGTTRNWALQCFFEGNLNQAQKALAGDAGTEKKEIAEDFFAVFGHEGHRGAVQFHDGWLEGAKLAPDIMTVHFSKYYRNEKSPTDDQSPIPISFYVVTCERVFLSLSSAKQSLSVDDPQHRLLQVAGIWMEKALTELGIGAKTTSGYGLFAGVEDVTGREMRRS